MWYHHWNQLEHHWNASWPPKHQSKSSYFAVCMPFTSFHSVKAHVTVQNAQMQNGSRMAIAWRWMIRLPKDEQLGHLATECLEQNWFSSKLWFDRSDCCCPDLFFQYINSQGGCMMLMFFEPMYPHTERLWGSAGPGHVRHWPAGSELWKSFGV